MSAGDNTICFEVDSNNGTVMVDDVEMRISRMHEEVTYHLHEEVSTMNKMLVSLHFRDYFQHRYWLNGSLTEQVQILIHGKEVEDAKIRLLGASEDQVELEVEVEENLCPNSKLTLNILDESFSIPEAPSLVFEERREGRIPLIPYYSEEERRTNERMANSTTTVARSVGTSSNGFCLVGATYLISSLFGFLNVLILFSFLDLQFLLYPYRHLCTVILGFYWNNADLSIFLENLGLPVSIEADPQIPEAIDHPQMHEKGLTSNFLVNNWNEFLNVLLMVVKITLVRLLALLPIHLLRKGYQSIKKRTIIYILY